MMSTECTIICYDTYGHCIMNLDTREDNKGPETDPCGTSYCAFLGLIYIKIILGSKQGPNTVTRGPLIWPNVKVSFINHIYPGTQPQ